MKLTFLGAAHEVTGSCFLLEANDKNLLIDCGMEQGADIYENQEIPINTAEIDYVLLTHAHIDHSGNLPLIYKNGFKGEVYMTKPSSDLANIMLQDCAHIQEFEAEWRNRKGKRAGKEPYEPIYTMEDALGVIQLFHPCEYNERIEICDGISINFVDAGHLLGSASIEVFITEHGISRKLVFSGDIGNKSHPILKEPQYITDADYVIMESTYGDRSHGPVPNYTEALAGVIRNTFKRGGNVVIPSFAVGRTQELLYCLREIKANNLIPEFPNFPVYVDSPLAVEATNIFNEHIMSCCDETTRDLIKSGINPIRFPDLKLSVTSDDSKLINSDLTRKVILSASGMCEAGRIRHHLKHNLWRPESTILFVGYQTNGTLGRAILEGASSVKLFGEEVEIKAEIRKLAGISGHADDKGLMEWAGNINRKVRRVFVVHGEDTICDKFAERLNEELEFTASAPYNGESWDLIADCCLDEGNREKLVRPVVTVATKKASVFQRLLDAGKRLMQVIHNNEGGANKDLANFADQINSLCDKWDNKF